MRANTRPDWWGMVSEAMFVMDHPDRKRLIGTTLAELEFLKMLDTKSRWVVKHLVDKEVQGHMETHLRRCIDLGRLPPAEEAYRYRRREEEFIEEEVPF